jgi:hypothetical protein
MKAHLKLLGVGICGLGLSLSTVQSVHGQTAAAKKPNMFFLSNGPIRPGDLIFSWSQPATAGACGIDGASLTFHEDGSASWRSVVSSIDSNNAYCVTMSFLDSGGRTLFAWPRFCSQTLTYDWQVWARDNLAYPTKFYSRVRIASRRDHC